MAFGLPLPSLDTLLSLPLLSFLVLPSALSSFSWTTSLNLLFFYLAWATVVFSHDPFNIELFGSLAVRVLFYVLPCLLFLAFDVAIPSLSTSIKHHGKRARPLTALGAKRSRRQLVFYVAVCVGNILLAIAVQSAIEYLFIHVLHMRSVLRISSSLPMPMALAKDLTRAYLVRGPVAYYIHRYLLHDPHYSRTLTRWHKKWQHGLSTAMPFSASYDHPVVYLINRWLPVYLPAFLFRFHNLTFLLFLSLISLEEAFAWSGYRVLPSTVLLAGMARRTEDHLMTGGRGNFGPWGVMDWIHGTTIGDKDIMDDVEEEMVRQDVRGKARKAARKASEKVGDVAENLNNEDEEIDSPDAEDTGEVDGPSRARKLARRIRKRK